MSDNPDEITVPTRDGLYFVTDGMFYVVSGHEEPNYRSERDIAVLRAFLRLALDRLDAPPRLTLPTTAPREGWNPGGPVGVGGDQ